MWCDICMHDEPIVSFVLLFYVLVWVLCCIIVIILTAEPNNMLDRLIMIAIVDYKIAAILRELRKEDQMHRSSVLDIRSRLGVAALEGQLT